MADEIEELYDLQADPQELTNLAQSQAHQAVLAEYQQRMMAELRRTYASLVDNLPAPRPAAAFGGAD